MIAILILPVVGLLGFFVLDRYGWRLLPAPRLPDGWRWVRLADGYGLVYEVYPGMMPLDVRAKVTRCGGGWRSDVITTPPRAEPAQAMHDTVRALWRAGQMP